MKCMKCGTRNPAGARYCLKCQTPLAAEHVRRYCTRCSRYYPPGTQYCPHCQSELTDRQQDPRLLWIIGGITAAVTAAALLVTGILIYPSRAFQNAIAQQDAQRLALVCREHRGLLRSEERKQAYRSFMDDCVEAYLYEQISYSEVTQDLSFFDQINSHAEDEALRTAAASARSRLDAIHAGRVQFMDALRAAEEQQYASAEEGFQTMTEDDPLYYPLARQKLSEIEDAKASYLSQASELLKAADYDGSIGMLTEGLTVFSYDEDYCEQYRDGIVNTVITESEALMQEGYWFSADGNPGAFNLVYSYLQEPDYADQKLLRAKLLEIAQKSESFELAAAETALGLGETASAVDRLADTAAEAYFHDPSIQDSNAYIQKLCQEDAGVQSLLGGISPEHQINAALICGIAMSAADFTASSRSQIDAYADETWEAVGLGRYYSETHRQFSWAVILLYEPRETE